VFIILMIHFFLIVNRQGKIRLSKWFSTYTPKEKSRTIKEITNTLLKRGREQCNFFDYGELIIVYRRYASIFFVVAIDRQDNELIVLDIIHQFCLLLDKYFGNVCELDIVFYFDKVYLLLDEYLLARVTVERETLHGEPEGQVLRRTVLP
jgi:AP-1 complex subunit sigma 1/2